MVAGGDSIDDLDRLRHGGMGWLCFGTRAPSTWGTFLRAFTFGHVEHLDTVRRDGVVKLARRIEVGSEAEHRLKITGDWWACGRSGGTAPGSPPSPIPTRQLGTNCRHTALDRCPLLRRKGCHLGVGSSGQLTERGP